MLYFQPNTKPNHKTIQHQTKESLPLAVQQKKITHVNNALLSLANQIFGEEKWSYSVTNQTLGTYWDNISTILVFNEIYWIEEQDLNVYSILLLDFVDFVWDIYVVGCCTFIKVQLQSGIFHEDIGYSVKEGSVKGETIHCARLVSRSYMYIYKYNTFHTACIIFLGFLQQCISQSLM